MKWQTKELGELCKFIDYRGKTPPKTEAGCPLITAKNIKNGFIKREPREFVDPNIYDSWMTRGIPKRGDILFTTEAPLANIAQLDIDEKVVFAQRIIILQPHENIIDSAFLKYLLLSSSMKEKILNKATGATVQGIKASLLKKVEINYLKSLTEQQRIVVILDKAFSAIDKVKSKAEQNRKNAKELFESYLQNVFENKSGAWEERRLGDNKLLEIIDGDRGRNYPTKKDFLDEGHCLFLNTKNVRKDGFEFNKNIFINEVKDKAMGKGKLNRNDVVMTTRGTIGNLGVFNDDIEFDNIRINSGMLIFRPDLKRISSEYLFEILRSGVIKYQIKKHVTGAAQPQLPIKTLVNFVFPVPKSLNSQKMVVQKLNILSAETKKLETIYQAQINELKELKKSFLQKAFNGELIKIQI